LEPIRQDVSRQPFPKVTQMKHTCGRTWLSFACFLLFLAVSLAILLAWLSCARKPVAPAACTRDQLHQLALALMVYVTEGRRAPMPAWMSLRVAESSRDKPNGTNMHFCLLIREEVWEARPEWVRHDNRESLFVDPWGRPLVLVGHPDYENRLLYDFGEGPVALSAARQFGGSHVFPHSLQVWSVGPNGVNESGGGDDIALWHTWPGYDAEFLRRSR